PLAWERPRGRVVLLVPIVEEDAVNPGAHDRAQGPADPPADVVIVRDDLALGSHIPADVTGGARGSGGVVLSQDPISRLVQGHSRAIRLECDAMLGFS